jgi:uncharacterized protein (TIGR02270 family)
MQHVEESAHLRHVRSVLVRAPHVRLLQLGRIDERIAAHLDGVAIAGEYGVSLAHKALEQPGRGQIFVAAVRAIEDHDVDRLDKLLGVAEAVPASRAGLLSAFGWVAAADLQRITKSLLESASPWRREVGLAACAMHGVDPGSILTHAIRDPDQGLRARALRGAGCAGRLDLLDACLARLTDEDPHCAFEAVRSALLLGDRTGSLGALEALAVGPDAGDPHALAALRLVVKAVSPKRAQAMLVSLAKNPALIRPVIQGIAMAGDPHYVPWLIAQMEDLKLARLAGEAFSFITGLDLAYLDLERKPPAGVEFGPNNDPADENVAMDEDDSLPWPDPAKLTAWWKANGARFVSGTRYFMGEVPSVENCTGVLNTGFQRQRYAAAEYLVLLAPGAPMFNVRAPAWRQARLLKRMTAASAT